jgi:hypothetical protein
LPSTDLAAEYQAGTEEMEALQDGLRLAAAAASIARMLPAGRLRLLSTSPEGAGLAAVCAASRGASTSWQFAHLAYPPRTRIGEQVVFIEPIDPGEAWEAAVKRCYGDALILYATELAESQPQAA